MARKDLLCANMSKSQCRPVLLWQLLLLLLLLLMLPGTQHGLAEASRPWVIAHRGSSGDIPELTLKAFERAAEEGADMLELDTAVTRDHQVIVLHEPNLSPTTDIANFPQFRDRMRNDSIESEGYTETVTNDFFTWNFSLAEVQQLRKQQRFSFRDSSLNGQEVVPSLRQVIQLVKRLDAARKPGQRRVALLIEVKLCRYFTNRTGRIKEELIAEDLAAEGLTDRPDLIHLQTFELKCAAELKRRLPGLPVYKLEQASDISDADLTAWRRDLRLDGIGVHKAMVAAGADPGKPKFSYKYIVTGETTLVERARRLANFKVLVWTLRNEDRYIPWTFSQDASAEAAFYTRAGVDGLITDFPKTIRRVVDAPCSGVRLGEPALMVAAAAAVTAATFGLAGFS